MRGLDRVERLLLWMYRGLAGCLALLLWISPLAPLALALSGGSSVCVCCQAKGKNCCRRHHGAGNAAGPAVSNASCNPGCGQTAMAARTAGAAAPLEFQNWTPAFALFGLAPARAAQLHSFGSPLDLRQRPPPVLPRA
jgi:hypothetical protein